MCANNLFDNAILCDSCFLTSTATITEKPFLYYKPFLSSLVMKIIWLYQQNRKNKTEYSEYFLSLLIWFHLTISVNK